MPRALVAILVLAGCAAGCRKPHREPRLVLARKEGGQTRLVELAPSDGPPRPVLPEASAVAGVRAIEGGRALLVLVGEELWRVRVGVALEKDAVVARGLRERIVAVADGGGAILVERDERVALVRLGGAGGGGETPLHEFRWFAGGDLSPDGTRAVLAGTPTTCTEPLARCPVDLLAVDLAASPPAVRTLRSGGARGAHYMPSFVPGTGGALVAYQSTANDDGPACAEHLNNCRHDLMTIPWEGGEPTLLRRGPALGPYFAPDGKTYAYLSYDEKETACRSVVCDSMSVYVAGPGGEAVRIVTANAASVGRHAFSPDGRWLTYLARDRKSLEVVRVDGKKRRTLGEAAERAWIR